MRIARKLLIVQAQVQSQSMCDL